MPMIYCPIGSRPTGKTFRPKLLSFGSLMTFVLLIGEEQLRFSFLTSAPLSILLIIDGSWITSPHAAGFWMMLWPGSHPTSLNVPSLSASVPLSRHLWLFATAYPRDLCLALLPSSLIRHRFPLRPSVIMLMSASSPTTQSHPRPSS